MIIFFISFKSLVNKDINFDKISKTKFECESFDLKALKN